MYYHPRIQKSCVLSKSFRLSILIFPILCLIHFSSFRFANAQDLKYVVNSGTTGIYAETINEDTELWYRPYGLCAGWMTVYVITEDEDLFSAANSRLEVILNETSDQVIEKCNSTKPPNIIVKGYLNEVSVFEAKVQNPMGEWRLYDRTNTLKERELRSKCKEDEDFRNPWLHTGKTTLREPNACQMILSLDERLQKVFRIAANLLEPCSVLNEAGCIVHIPLAPNTRAKVNITHFKKVGCTINEGIPECEISYRLSCRGDLEKTGSNAFSDTVVCGGLSLFPEMYRTITLAYFPQGERWVSDSPDQIQEAKSVEGLLPTISATCPQMTESLSCREY